MTSTVDSNGIVAGEETKGKPGCTDAAIAGKRADQQKINGDLRVNGDVGMGEAMDCEMEDGGDEIENGQKTRNGIVDAEGDEEDDDDLSSDIGLIEDDEDLDDLAAERDAAESENKASQRADLGSSVDIEMLDGDASPPFKSKRDDNSLAKTTGTADHLRSVSRQSAASDNSVEESEEPEIVEHVVKLVVNQLVNVVALTASAYKASNTLKRRRQEMDMDEDDLIDEIEDGDIETRIKCVDILHNRHEQIRLKREQRLVGLIYMLLGNPGCFKDLVSGEVACVSFQSPTLAFPTPALFDWVRIKHWSSDNS